MVSEPMIIIDPLEITVAPFDSLMVVAFVGVVREVVVPPGFVVFRFVVVVKFVPGPVGGKVVFVKVEVFPKGGDEVVIFPEVPVCVIIVVKSVMVFVTNPVVRIISVVVKLWVSVSVSVVVSVVVSVFVSVVVSQGVKSCRWRFAWFCIN